MDHIILKTDLPNRLGLVPGSVQLFNTNYPGGHVMSDSGLFERSVDVGRLAVGGNGYLRFRTELSQEAAICHAELVTVHVSAHATGVGNFGVVGAVTVRPSC